MSVSKRIACLFLSLMMTVSLLGCSGKGEAADPVLLEPVSVSAATVTVERGNIYDMMEIAVTVVPEVTDLYFEVSGRIKNIHLVPGDLVKAGDVLVELDQTALDKAVAAKEAEINRTEVQNSFANQGAAIRITIAQLSQTIAEKALENAKKALETAKETAATQADGKAVAIQSAEAAATAAQDSYDSAKAASDAAQAAADTALAAAQDAKKMRCMHRRKLLKRLKKPPPHRLLPCRQRRL